MTNWKPDTCDCEIDFDDDLKFIKGVPCKLHSDLGRQKLLDEVIKHNRSFNLKYGNKELTEEEAKDIKDSKKAERERIRNI